MSSLPEEKLPKDFGKYRLMKRIATGGMAEIFLAHARRAPDVPIVVKRILPHLAESKEFLSMFLDEARIAARLQHSNIVAIEDLGQIDGAYYISMEYVHGEDIRRIYNRAFKLQRSLPLSHSIRVIAEAAMGLAHAHKLPDLTGRPLGVVHRDVSPQNILVTYEGRVKVVDFGIAKAANKVNQTRAGVLKGKYSYMSPEQAMGEAIDHRTDIFALGIILYETTTGTRLFKRPSELATLQAVIKAEVTPPSAVLEGYPPELEAIVLRALARDARDRYQDADNFSDELYDFLDLSGLYVDESHIAEFMKDLFSERLDEESVTGAPAVPEEHEVREELVGEPTRSVQSVVAELEVNTANERDAVAVSTGDATSADRPGRESDRPDPSIPSPRAVRPKTTPGFSDEHDSTRGSAGTIPEEDLEDLERIARRVFEDAKQPTDTSDDLSPFNARPIAFPGSVSDTLAPERPGALPKSRTSELILPVEDSVDIPATLTPPLTVQATTDELPTEYAQPAYRPPSKDPSRGARSEEPEAPLKPTPRPRAVDATDRIRASRAKPAIAARETTPERRGSNTLVIALAAALALALAALVTVLLRSESNPSPVPPSPPPEAPATAELSVRTEPLAAVTIDGTLVGKADGQGVAGPFQVPPGRHELEVELESTGFVRARTIDVVAGKAYDVEAPARRGLLRLVVAPWARVKIDGKEIGVTPLASVPLPEGQHRVVLTNPELGKRHELSVKIEADGTAEVKVDLAVAGEKLAP
ncbi:MAG: protein kinase [Deltaproteobacteria bacterium]|nr:protein kinase [Deltaproteobacteria bacterium]